MNVKMVVRLSAIRWSTILGIGLIVGSLLLLAGGAFAEPPQGRANLKPSIFQSAESTNPVDPEFLVANDVIYEWYMTGNTNYYYKNLGGSRYNVVWLCPAAGEKDQDLYVFADSGYTQLLGASAKGAGELEWVIFGHQVGYPQVYVHSDSAGCAWIEWDTSVDACDLG
jgi:hypothetical protein